MRRLALELEGLRLPVIGAPMFQISTPALVIAQCTAGIVGAIPALNARPSAQLDEWLHEITEALAAWNQRNPENPAAPFAVNQIVHSSNPRWETDVEICGRWEVPIIISSLGAREDLNRAVHAWGGITLHDVVSNRFGQKAIQKGADGLIAVAAGAGGHAGQQSPFALVQEIRSWFDGFLALSGAIATGRSILAALVLGADMAYIGSLFIATDEASATNEYKRALVDGDAGEIIYSRFFSGIHGNYLRASIVAAGLDPNDLPERDLRSTSANGTVIEAKAWTDIWGSGQGIGVIRSVESVAARVEHLRNEYLDARRSLKDSLGESVLP
ncbi:MAG: nitronate monooxygenase [Acidimicrobiaceae bacterium]|jgi:nitronate monooxygenase|nr:nitronate monooxygenase [Acidimicrobiaceae bacterium]